MRKLPKVKATPREAEPGFRLCSKASLSIPSVCVFQTHDSEWMKGLTLINPGLQVRVHRPMDGLVFGTKVIISHFHVKQ